MNTPARRARGFTLVELMIVVAIIGILASVAMPTFKTFVLRSRASERRTVMKYMKIGIEDMFVQHGRAQDGQGNPLSVIFASPNPPLPLTTGKRAFRPALAGWDTLNATTSFIDGAVYYSYDFYVLDFPGSQWVYLHAQGDLDGDTRVSEKQIWYQYENQLLVTHPEWGWITPPDGQEDDGYASNPTF